MVYRHSRHIQLAVVLIALMCTPQLIGVSASPWQVVYSSARQTDRSVSVVVGVHSDQTETVTVTEWVTYLLKGSVSIQIEQVTLEYETIMKYDDTTVVVRERVTTTRTIIKVTPSVQATLSRTVTHTLKACVPFVMGTGWSFGTQIPAGAEIVECGYRITGSEVVGTPPVLVGVLPGIEKYLEVDIFNAAAQPVAVRVNVTGPAGWDCRMEDLLANRTTEAIFTIPPNTAVIDHLVVTPPTNLSDATMERVEIRAVNEVTGRVLSTYSFLLAYDTQEPDIISSNAYVINSGTQLVGASISSLDVGVGIDFFGAELHYSTDNGTTWSSRGMDWSAGNLTSSTDFNATIGPFLYDTKVLYYFTVMDLVGNINSTGVGELRLPSDPLIEENQKLRGDLDALNASYQQLQSDYEDLEARVASLLADVSSLTQTVTSQNQTIASLNANLTASKEAIASLQGQISDLTATVATQNQTIISQNTQIAGLQTTIGSQSGTITSLQGQVSSLETDLNTTRTMMYVLAATTVVLLATTVYFARRKPKL